MQNNSQNTGRILRFTQFDAFKIHIIVIIFLFCEHCETVVNV